MCNPTKARVNGSVWKHPGGIWTATIETELKGRRAFLKLDGKPWPELSVKGVLDHDSPALSALPKSSRLSLSSSSGAHSAEVLIQMDECSLRVGGDVMPKHNLQVSLVYHNNCTVIQVQVKRSCIASAASLYWLILFSAWIKRSGSVRTVCRLQAHCFFRQILFILKPWWLWMPNSCTLWYLQDELRFESRNDLKFVKRFQINSESVQHNDVSLHVPSAAGSKRSIC